LFSQVGDKDPSSTEDRDGTSQGADLTLNRIGDTADPVDPVEDEPQTVNCT